MKISVLVSALLFLFAPVCGVMPASALEKTVNMQPTAIGSKPMPLNAPTKVAAGRVFKATSLTKPEFDQLKNSDKLDIQGKQYDVGTILGQVQKTDVARKSMSRQTANRIKAEFVAYRNRFSQEQQGKLAVANAKVISQQKQVAASAAPLIAKTVARPMITDLSNNVTPGLKAIIAGTGFGSTRGTATLYTGNASIPLVIDGWGDQFVFATIPGDIVGLPDGPGTVAVNAGGVESNRWPVAFTATREVILMMGPQGKEVFSCATSAVTNGCLNEAGEDSIQAGHGGNLLMWKASGTDVYKASLKNGWTFNHTTTYLVLGKGKLALKGFDQAATSLTLVAEWSFDVDWSGGVPIPGSMFYFIGLYAVGPKGISYF